MTRIKRVKLPVLDGVRHVVLAQDSAGKSTAFGPFSSEGDAESYARRANDSTRNGYQYTALFLLPPDQLGAR